VKHVNTNGLRYCYLLALGVVRRWLLARRWTRYVPSQSHMSVQTQHRNTHELLDPIAPVTCRHLN